jgi:carboxyl-terminal processing protease
MKIFKLFIVSLFFFTSIFSEDSSSSPDSKKIDIYNEIYHFENDEALLKEILKVLENEHYLKKTYEEIRLDALKLYIKRLDPGKTIFLENEIIIQEGRLDAQKTTISKDLKIAYKIFNLYKNRYIEKHNFQVTYLKLINKESLNLDRQIIRDREDMLRPQDINSLHTTWENLIINDLIQLVLSGNELEESKSKISKRLNNQFNYFKQTREEDIFNIFSNSITNIYGPHTNYMSPKRSEDFDIDMSLSLEGIGALLSSDGMYTEISSLIAGGPAEKSGVLKPKDRIIGVAQSSEDEMTNIVGWRIDDVVKLIRGPKGSKVSMEIIPSTSLNDSNTREIEIVRNLVKLEDQAAEKKILSKVRDADEYRIGVIKLPAFYFDFEAYQKKDYNYRSSSKDVKELIKDLKKENVDGLIIDLRNNGGGSLYEAQALANIFLGRGAVVQIQNSSGNINSLGEVWGSRFYKKPLAILVNKFSASASEILAGVVKDYDRGIVVGTQTFGKGTVQRVSKLSLGQIKFTDSKFYRVSGSSTQNKGVTPHITLPSSVDIEEFGESKLPWALDHDNITATSHRNFKETKRYLRYLQENNKERILNSQFYKNLNLKKDWGDRQNKKFITLNLSKREQQKIIAEEEILAIENSLRLSIGLETYSTYQEFLDRDEDIDEINIDKIELNETAEILIDLIEANKKLEITSAIAA